MCRDKGNEKYQPEMPPLQCGEHLISYLFEVGPVLSGGMGPAVLSHQEIASWSGLIGIALQPWEVRLLRRLSAAYISEAREAEKPNHPPPWASPELAQAARIAQARKLREAMRRLAKL